VIKVDLTEDLDAVETAIENHRNAMDHLWTKMRKPESERDKNEPHQPRFGHPSQYAWLMAREYQEEHGAIIQLASEKHTGSEFHKPEVLLADAKPTIDDQGFGYTLSWNHGIRNDTVPISKAAADTLNEQRTQANYCIITLWASIESSPKRVESRFSREEPSPKRQENRSCRVSTRC